MAAMASENDHDGQDLFGQDDNEQSDLFAIEEGTVHGADDMLCVVAHYYARLLSTYSPKNISEGAKSFNSNIVYYTCGKMGHISRNCPQAPKPVPWGSNSRMRNAQRGAPYVKQQSAPFKGKKLQYLKRHDRSPKLYEMAEEEEEEYVENGGSDDLTFALLDGQLFLTT